MEQFIVVAAAHFLALLIPGVDFFLIARTAMSSGWRTATGACAGIALANGLFIAAAFSGLSLVSQPAVLSIIQAAGGAFLTYIGIAFLRAPARMDVSPEPGAVHIRWLKSLGLGFTSGLLNPKNALFYASLAAALAGANPVALIGYGVWMFAVVLVWDLFIAVALGSRRALGRLAHILPWLMKGAGGFLVLFGIGMIVGLLIELR